MSNQSEKAKSLVVVSADGGECLYIDGKRWKWPDELTVYACDIAEAAGDALIRFELLLIDQFEGEWPLELKDIRAEDNPARALSENQKEEDSWRKQ